MDTKAELLRIAKQATEQGERGVASVLYSLLGAMTVSDPKALEELNRITANYSKEIIRQIEELT